MNTSHPRRISRKAVEQLLESGSPAPAAIPEPLARLLATAAAPPRPDELAREEMAVAAFGAEHLVPVTASRRGQMRTSSLAKFLTTKIAALALAICTTGGIALAATVGSLHGSGSAGAHVTAGASSQAPASGGAGAAAQGSGSASVTTPTATGSASATGSGSGSVSSLCLALTSEVHAIITGQASAGSQGLPVSGLEQALASPVVSQVVTHPGFARLVAQAGGNANVADYCAVTLSLPQLPSVQTVADLPASVLADVPVSTLVTLPVSVLSQLPVPVLSTLPVPVLSQLPVSVLSKLPAPVLAKLPVSILSQLSASVLAKLPASVLSQLPASVLSQLPPSVLSELPPSVLSQLPASVLSQLPASVLATLPSGL